MALSQQAGRLAGLVSSAFRSNGAALKFARAYAAEPAAAASADSGYVSQVSFPILGVCLVPEGVPVPTGIACSPPTTHW